MSKFGSVTRKPKPVDKPVDLAADAATAAFIAGAVERVEGVAIAVKNMSTGGKVKKLYNLDQSDADLVVTISQRHAGVKCSSSAVVTAAIRAFDDLPHDQQIALLKKI